MRSLTHAHTIKTNDEDVSDSEPEISEPSPTLDDTTNEDLAATSEDTNKPKSPLLTSHRISTSDLDNVNLEDGGVSDEAVHGRGGLVPIPEVYIVARANM
jgi:hypothetical protein